MGKSFFLELFAYLVSVEHVVSLVDGVLLEILVLPHVDPVLVDGAVVDSDLPARLDAVRLAVDDVTGVVGEDLEKGRVGGGDRGRHE